MLPTWVPVLVLPLKKWTPVTDPATLDWNLRPTSMAEASDTAAVPGVVAFVQMLFVVLVPELGFAETSLDLLLSPELFTADTW
jgi:hypothetical protein